MDAEKRTYVIKIQIYICYIVVVDDNTIRYIQYTIIYKHNACFNFIFK